MEQLFSRGGRFMTLAQVKEWEKRKKVEEGVIEELEKEVKKFCEFCDAKGPIKHKKDCPTLVKKVPEEDNTPKE